MNHLNKALLYGWNSLTTASVAPTYLFFILTDLIWGIMVLINLDFHPDIPSYDLINTTICGWVMVVFGIIGLINFFVCKRWVIIIHSMFNMAFYAFITLVQIHLRDGAFARNGVVMLLAMWVMLRLQTEYAQELLKNNSSISQTQDPNA